METSGQEQGYYYPDYLNTSSPGVVQDNQTYSIFFARDGTITHRDQNGIIQFDPVQLEYFFYPANPIQALDATAQMDPTEASAAQIAELNAKIATLEAEKAALQARLVEAEIDAARSTQRLYAWAENCAAGHPAGGRPQDDDEEEAVNQFSGDGGGGGDHGDDDPMDVDVDDHEEGDNDVNDDNDDDEADAEDANANGNGQQTQALQPQHLRYQYGPHSFPCVATPDCLMGFRSQNNLDEHVASTHNARDDPAKPIRCPNCRGRYASEASLKKHLPMHIPGTASYNQTLPIIGGADCAVCGANFPTLRLLITHRAKAHKGWNGRRLGGVGNFAAAASP